MSEFPFEPASWIPFKDKAEIERVRNIKREDIEKHPNPDFKIRCNHCPLSASKE